VILVDTSVWVDVFRDARGGRREKLARAIGDEEVVLSRFTQLELLQGSRDEKEWGLLASYLGAQDYLELDEDSWPEAARIYFDLRRRRRTVRSPIDCCIAQAAIDYGALLIHRDRDFETIAEVRPLRQTWLDWR
jgi:hypothetical protein